MDLYTYRDLFKKSLDKFNKLNSFYDEKKLLKEADKLKSLTYESSFWENNKKATVVLKKIKLIEDEMKLWRNFIYKKDEAHFFIELLKEDEAVSEEHEIALNNFIDLIEKIEITKMLSSSNDKNDAILTIHPGAGGKESQDWAHMLYRLYSRWAERNGFNINIIDYQDGDEAGIKDVTMEIIGSYAYGKIKSEVGVHRLVRISPYDSNSRRHTSFASIFVYPQFEDEIDIKLDDADIRIDTYRASGAGGQHVNKTDSAVRITHIPTNIVVQCQNQRSQLKNKNTAIKLLKAKLHQRELDEANKEHDDLTRDKKDIAWGSQIRSYVFHPYNLVKDHRTKHETSNVNDVMDGDINDFIKAYLLNFMEN